MMAMLRIVPSLSLREIEGAEWRMPWSRGPARPSSMLQPPCPSPLVGDGGFPPLEILLGLNLSIFPEQKKGSDPNLPRILKDQESRIQRIDRHSTFYVVLRSGRISDAFRTPLTFQPESFLTTGVLADLLRETRKPGLEGTIQPSASPTWVLNDPWLPIQASK